MSTRRIAAWIGALSLAGLGLAAVAGIVALRLLESGHLGRVITGAGPDGAHRPSLVTFTARGPEGSDAAGKAPDGQAVPDASDPDAAARRDCLELLAQGGGEDHLLIRPAIAAAQLLPGVAIRVEGGPLEGMGHGQLELGDPMASLGRLLGLSTEALHKALDEDGKTLADLAKAQGKTLDQLEEELQAEARAELRRRLQAKVDAGEMSPEEADRRAQALRLTLDDEGTTDKGLRFTMKLKGPHFLHPGGQGSGEDAAAGDQEADLVFGFAAGKGAGAQVFDVTLPEALSDSDQAAVQKVLEEAVSAGRLTRAQADAAIARLKLPAWHGMPAIPAMPAIPSIPGQPADSAPPAQPLAPAAPGTGR